MAKDMHLKAFPEEITEDGVKVYGETSYENQMAVLSIRQRVINPVQLLM